MNETPGRLAALYSDPVRERKLGFRFLIAGIALLAIAALGVIALVQGTSLGRALIWVLIGGLGGLLSMLLAVNNLVLSRRTGEGLLTMAVEQDGLVGPEQIRVPWSQITHVTQTVHGKPRGGYTPRSLTIHVRDHDSLLATVADKQRWMVDRADDGAATVETGLGAVTDDDHREFLDVLRIELDRRQLPLVDRND